MRHALRLAASSGVLLIAACGQNNASDNVTPLGLEALSLHESGAGRVSFAQMSQEGAVYTFTDVDFAVDAGTLSAESMRLEDLRGVDGAPVFASLSLEGLTLDAAPVGAAATLDSLVLAEPTPAVGRVIAAVFAGDEDLEPVLAPLEPRLVGLGALTLDGLNANVAALDAATTLSIGTVEVSELDAETLGTFAVRAVDFDSPSPEGPVSIDVDAFSVTGLDATIFQELFDIAQGVSAAEAEADAAADAGQDTPTDTGALEAIFSSSLFTDIYAKRLDAYDLTQLAANIAGAKLEIASITGDLREEGGKLLGSGAGEGVVISADPGQGVLGEQLAVGLGVLGYESLNFSFGGAVTADPQADRMRADTYRITLEDGFSLNMTYDFGGLEEHTKRAAELGIAAGGVITDPAMAASMYEPLVIHDFGFSFGDQGITERAFAAIAAVTGEAPDDIKSNVQVGLLFLPAMADGPVAQRLAQDVAGALDSFFETPGVVSLSMTPPEPIQVGELINSANAPDFTLDSVIGRLGISVSHEPPPPSAADAAATDGDAEPPLALEPSDGDRDAGAASAGDAPTP